MKKILVATQKPFAPAAISRMKDVLDYTGDEMILLEKYASQDDLIQAVKDVDALIVRSDKVTKDVLDNANNLKIVVRAGAGYDNVDLAAATSKNIVVMNTPGQNSNAVAELVLGMMIFQARNGFNGTAGTELKGKTLGIHAFGNVGNLVAKIAKGFGMEVLAYDPFVANETIEKNGVKAVDTLSELYQESQYISLHIPANEHTIKSIDYNLLKQMPENAVLVNTARKEVIDEAGLIKLMQDRPDFKYISDIAPDSKADFETQFSDRFFFTPKKMGAQTAEANINAGVAATKQIIDYFKNGNLVFKVN